MTPAEHRAACLAEPHPQFQCAICLKTRRQEWASGKFARCARALLHEPPVCHQCQFRYASAQVMVGAYRDRLIMMNLSALAARLQALAAKKMKEGQHHAA